MSPECSLSRSVSARSQRGSALMISVFILTVALLLGSALVQVLNQARQGVTVEVYGVRARLAAQSGMERALHALFPPDVGLLPAPLGCGVIDSSVDYSGRAGLENCRADVSCQWREHQGVRYYHLRSLGSCQSGQADTSRLLTMDVQTQS